MAAHAKCNEIAVGDRPVLEKLASLRTAERRLVERAQIVLLAFVLHALIRAKVFVFAWAFDAVYGSDYSVRLSRRSIRIRPGRAGSVVASAGVRGWGSPLSREPALGR